jgi:hypothetical protein
MRELVMKKITENWIDDVDYSTGDELDLSLDELPNLSDEDLLDVLVEMVAFAG